jgi:predicted metal-dependent peptidase
MFEHFGIIEIENEQSSIIKQKNDVEIKQLVEDKTGWPCSNEVFHGS